MSQSAHLFLLQRDLSLACLGSRKCTTRLLEQKLVEPSTLPACYQRKGKIQVFKGLEFIKYRDPSAFCMKFNTSWMILSYLPQLPSMKPEVRSLRNSLAVSPPCWATVSFTVTRDCG